MMPNPDLVARAEALGVSVAELNESVRTLAASQTRLRSTTRLVAVGVVLGIVFGVVAVWLLIAQQRNSDRLAEANQRIAHIQARTSDDVLCPLYGLLLEFRDRSINNPALTPEERRQRQLAYEVITRGHAALGCK